MSIENRYDPKSIEPKWQEKWNGRDLFKTKFDPEKPKFYYLDMFPYPSGALHVGHVRNYAIGDAIARYHVMNGKNVLHPMGWDAFGLPAENAAIKNQVHPAEWTDRCIGQMHEQFGKLGIAFDWDREIATCKPDYYKWTQWLFIQMFKKGLIVRKTAQVNWCPVDMTVLANEQVKDGHCDRCGSLVEQKPLTQWFARTTEYAQRLLDDLETLPDWPERVVKMQREWIGRSEGVTFRFPLKGRKGEIEVFTTRVDTVFGVTYMVLAPDTALADELTKDTEFETPAREFRDRTARLKDEQKDRGADIPKEGIFTGAYCINPLNGEEVPIWLANYVVSDYGSGAVMAVPAHDDRDFEFAKQYGLPIKVVIHPPMVGTGVGIKPKDYDGPSLNWQSVPGFPAVDEVGATQAYTDKYNGHLVNSGEFNGLTPEEARKKIAESMEAQGIGSNTINYRLRDWCLSRQRYWGCPIPIIYKEDGSIETVPEDQLPVLLPRDVQFTGQGNPLETSPTFLNTVDSEGKPARRETDTMDTFVDSSWYFLRFCSPDAGEVPFRVEDIARWMPVDQYVGGIEHATMHLIYARFWTKVLFDLGLVPVSEPFPRLFTQGMVTMQVAGSGKAEKMSKSKGNVVSLDDAVDRFGADATRMMTLFMGPPAMDAEWTPQSEETFAGTFRFLERVWRVSQAQPFVKDWRGQLDVAALSDADKKLRRKTHQTILRVQDNIERFSMNTAISGLMEFVNALQEWLNANKEGGNAAVYSEAVESLLLVLSPFAPHISDELLSQFGFEQTAYETTWPVADEEAAKEDEIVIPVQVNGKLRTRLTVSPTATQDELQTLALSNAEVSPHLGGKEPKKVVVVPGRLVNIVV